MGAHAECLNTPKDRNEIDRRRKGALSKISGLRGNRDILALAADPAKPGARTAMDRTDLPAVRDQLEGMSGDAVDVVLETPGGFAEAAEDIVRLIRGRYDSVGVIIPGQAKGAGTALAMAGDEILMGKVSALGPVDGQVQLAHGKLVSASAFLWGLERIREEAEGAQTLNPALIPILQNIYPGEIQRCEDVRRLSRHLTAEWLAKYKFRHWRRHPNGRTVTRDEKRDRAEEIAANLCSRSRWLTLGRSIRIADLEGLGIKITDCGKNRELSDAITGYYTLLRTSFETTHTCKIFETPNSQICRTMFDAQSAPQGRDRSAAELPCPKCGGELEIRPNPKDREESAEGAAARPASADSVACAKCGERTTPRRKTGSGFGDKAEEWTAEKDFKILHVRMDDEIKRDPLPGDRHLYDEIPMSREVTDLIEIIDAAKAPPPEPKTITRASYSG